jgi:hypothetical protein
MNRQQMIDILLEENVNGDWTDNYYFEKDNIHIVWCSSLELWLMLDYKTFPFELAIISMNNFRICDR